MLLRMEETAALADVIAGNAHLYFTSPASAMPFMPSGRLRMVAVASLKRSALLPDLPTVAEAGYPDFDVSSWWGVVAPAATPRDIVSRLTSALLKVLDQPATRDAFARLGAEVTKSTPDDMHKQLAGDLARWQKVQQMTGLRLD